jgi:hypothetical protein
MNSLTTQFHVPPKEARAIAEDLVGGTFKCPLGGEYVLTDPNAPAPLHEATEEQLPPPDGAVASATVDSTRALAPRKLWTSTAVPVENRFLLTEVPADYQMPMLNWFRGIHADLARGGDELRVFAELDMVHLDVAPEPTDRGEGFKLPSFGNLFDGLGRSKDDKVKPASVDEDLPPPAKQ